MKLDFQAIITAAFTNILQGQIAYTETLDEKDQDKHIFDSLSKLKALAAKYEKVAAEKDFS